MSLQKKKTEIRRLIAAFEIEAQKFHDLRFSVRYVTQEKPKDDVRFANPNHCIMLWQYYGQVGQKNDTEHLLQNLEESNLQWGLRGADITAFGVIEGPTVNLFVRMAKRAGNLFNKKEVEKIKQRATADLLENIEKEENTKTVYASNNDLLAIWLNFIIYHMSLDHPERGNICNIGPDPFTLSLHALEFLFKEQTIEKIDKSSTNIQDIQFRVALSFPGEKRTFIAETVGFLRDELGKDAVFYDYDYQAQLARPNLDILLQEIYLERSDLVVVFLCSEYASKEWCGLEWRAIRNIIKSRKDENLMFFRFDNAKVEGVFPIDGYIDAGKYAPEKISKFIVERVNNIRINA